MRLVPVALLLALACVLATQAGGSSRAADPASVVTAYAQAIGAHDAATVCKLFSSGVREDLDRVGRTVARNFPCAAVVTWTWSPDEGLAGFTSVEILAVGAPTATDGLEAVPLSARVTFDDGSMRTVDDVVWLQDDNGLWAVAKPSALLAAVSHWGDWWSRYGEPAAEPDLAAYARLRQAERDAEAKANADEAKSWAALASGPVRCGGVVGKGANPRLTDMMPPWSNGEGLPTKDEIDAIEIARSTLTRTARAFCLDIWTRAPLPPTSDVELHARTAVASRNPRTGKATPSISLDVMLAGARGKLVRDPGYERAGTPVTARIERDGRHVQVVFARSVAARVLGAKRFYWSLVSTTTRPGSELTYGDYLPRNGHSIEYPSNRLVLNR
jgi:hypothetical protein